MNFSTSSQLMGRSLSASSANFSRSLLASAFSESFATREQFLETRFARRFLEIVETHDLSDVAEVKRFEDPALAVSTVKDRMAAVNA